MPTIVLLIALGAMYAFLIVPQQRRMKAHQALLKSLEPGDMVVTSAGIHGAIVEVEGNIVWLEVAPDIELKVSLSAISERLPDDDEEDDDDLDEMADADDLDA